MFFQSQSDFQSGAAALRSFQCEEEAQHIENECLGMAVMAISHDAIGKNLPARELARKFKYDLYDSICIQTVSRKRSRSHDPVLSSRYKSYIPASLNQSISQRNLLTRLRISNVFKVFLKEFNDKTVLNSSVTKHDLKVKYISTLETLTTHFGCEVYEPKSLSIHENNEVPSGSANEDGARRRLLVSGTCGIKWQVVPPEVTLFFFFRL